MPPARSVSNGILVACLLAPAISLAQMGDDPGQPPPEPVLDSPAPLELGDDPRDTPPPIIIRSVSEDEAPVLAKKITTALEDYAAPTASPEKLEPHLGELTTLTGREAARLLWEAVSYAHRLLADLDTSQAFLEKRNKRLLSKAKRIRKSRRKGEKVNQEKLERSQRLLELSARKIAIQEAQRERLVAMCHHLAEAVGSMTSDQATRLLAGRFEETRVLPLRLEILKALAKAKAEHAVPVLIKRLSTRDEELKRALLSTLRELTGEDAGASKTGWRNWLHASRSRKETK